MERYKCKLCFKRFSNGRALGGHMRSHVMMMDLTQEPPRSDQHTDSASSPSLSSPFEQQKENTHHGNNDNQQGYVLRENPKKSIRLADPEFSFNKNMSSSAFVQDIESETESSKNDPTRRRSIRNSNALRRNHQTETRKKMKLEALCKNNESWIELEPANFSISSITTEEDVAYCLMMLARDNWKIDKQKQPEEEEVDDDVEDDEDDADDDEEEEEDLEEFKICRRSSARGKYKCETCKKVFKSYQALGGHRASHMKIKLSTHPKPMSTHDLEHVADFKIQEYECPFCFRVFSSGQALGGHKRSHGPGGGLNNNIAAPETRVKKIMEIAMIDLNLPAPIDDDDDNGGEFELSVVSNSAKR